MNLPEFKEKLSNDPSSLAFADTITIIDTLYTFIPSAFVNGDITNEKNQNNGSCKIFAFAQDQHFSKEETLFCFGEFYRKDVLKNPEGIDHQNIRNFMRYGWNRVSFVSRPLQKK